MNKSCEHSWEASTYPDGTTYEIRCDLCGIDLEDFHELVQATIEGYQEMDPPRYDVMVNRVRRLFGHKEMEM